MALPMHGRLLYLLLLRLKEYLDIAKLLHDVNRLRLLGHPWRRIFADEGRHCWQLDMH